MSQRLSSRDQESRPVSAEETCPECDGTLVEIEARGERSCAECGLIVDEDAIDHGPEWREFEDDDDEQKRRTGAPRTVTRHDNGLGAQMGYVSEVDVDNSVARRLNRQRNIDKRIGSRKDRNLITILTEVRRLCNAVDLGYKHIEQGCSIARSAHDSGLAMGSSLEALAAAAVYAACRVTQASRQLEEIAAHSSKRPARIRDEYGKLNQELGLPTPPPDATDHVHRIASNLDLSDDERRRAAVLVERYEDECNASGQRPSGIAAGAIYLATDGLTQAEIADVADSTTFTLRSRRDEMQDAGLSTDAHDLEEVHVDG